MQVIGIGVMGISSSNGFVQGLCGLAQGIAGLALTSQAANSRKRTGRKSRQPKAKPTALSEDFHDCLEEPVETYDDVPDGWELVSSPKSEQAQEESSQDKEQI